MRRRKGLVAVMIVVFAWSLFRAGSLMAQTFTGDILGVVTDPTGAAIAGAQMTARNMKTNVSTETVSETDGRYIFSRLLPGNYEIIATMSGFKRFVASDITLNVGSRVTVNIQMELGEVSATVEVKGAEELVKTDDVVLGQVITEKSIVALPLNGRNFVQLAQLSPGVLQIGTAISPVTSWTSRSDMSVVVAGLRETDTSYLLDGIETRSPRWGGTGFRPSVDAIHEFNVQRNAFSADQGWGTTVVNTVLRSGTNALHGTVYEFFRNDRLDARNFFDLGKKPPFKQNQFGFTVGGPLIKDRAFFFGNYEGFRQRLSTTLQGQVPPAEELQGRLTAPATDPLTGQPFPNNIIPLDRIDPIAKSVVARWPAPNHPGDPSLNFVRAPSRINDFDQIHTKFDFKLRGADLMFVRYSWVDEPLLQPSLFEEFGLRRPLGDQNVSVSHTHIFSTRLVNEFRVGYNRNKVSSVPEAAFGEDLARTIGLKNTSTNPASFGLPGFNITGFSGFGQGFTQTQETIDNLFQINENLTYTKGKHTLKLGADIRPDRFKITNDFPSVPSFSFDGRYTGNAIADFLLGLFNNGQAFIGSSTADFRKTSWSFFATDDWKIHPKLNLNFGLRYEYDEPFEEDSDRQGYLDFDTLKFVTVKEVGRRSVFLPDRNNFGPRVGFAYSPLSKTVLRGGFGLFYDLTAANETQFTGVLLPPISQVISIDNPTPVPAFRLADMFPPLEFGPQLAPNTTLPHNRTPYVYQYNLNLQQEYKGILFEAGYVGSTGHKLNRRFNMNLAPPDPNVPLAARRPFRGFGDILTSANNGWSNYNGFNLKVERRYSSGLLLLGAYTLGKALDIAGPDEYVHYDLTGTLKELVGPASLDTRQRLVMSYVYELPIGRGKPLATDVSGIADKLLSGWQVNGIATFSSGQPATPAPGGDWGNIGGRRIQPATRIGPGNSDKLKSEIRSQPRLFPYFNVNDFPLSPRGTVGNGGRNTIIRPGINNWDLGFLKDTLVRETVTIQFRAEFFNIFNHAQFAGLDVNLLSPSFGRITSARPPRDIQFGLKVIF